MQLLDDDASCAIRTNANQNIANERNTHKQVNFVVAVQNVNDKNACSFHVGCWLLLLLQFFMAFFRSFDAVVPFMFHFHIFSFVVFVLNSWIHALFLLLRQIKIALATTIRRMDQCVHACHKVVHEYIVVLNGLLWLLHTN